MAKQTKLWKKGRGKLGILSPLIGSWMAEATTTIGPVKCTRMLETVLGGHYIELKVNWHFNNTVYQEQALIGIREGVLSFWSFTSDGKNSQGTLADGTDIHPEAICFEALMPAGVARMVYWPSVDGGFYWAVESKTKKGWNRFTLHHYKQHP